MSRVDVIVPCYNYGRFLRQCVESVLTQEGVDVRVLIIDDASSDDSETVARELVRADHRVTFRRHAINQGHHRTYDEGLVWATRDYLLLLSADDVLAPGALQRATTLLDAHPNVGFVYGRAIKTTDPSQVQYQQIPHFKTLIIPGDQYLRTVCRSGENSVPTPTVVVRTNLQHRVGGYNPMLPHSGDMEMWMRFALHSSVGHIDAVQAFYRLHGQNMSAAYNNVRDFIERKKTFDHFFQSFGQLTPAEKRLRQRASRAVAENAFWTASKYADRADIPACNQLLAFASAAYPSIRYRSAWWRLKLKKRLGPKALSILRSMAFRSRNVPIPQPGASRPVLPVGPCW